MSSNTSKKINIASVSGQNDIQIGGDDESNELYKLNFKIVKFNHLDLFKTSKENGKSKNNDSFTLVIFDRIVKLEAGKVDSLTIKSNISLLSNYFKNNPYTVLRYLKNNSDLGLCCFDLRKIVPTNNTSDFLIDFCDNSETFSLKERCYLVNTSNGSVPSDSNGNKPYVELAINLKFLNKMNNTSENSKSNTTPKQHNLKSNSVDLQSQNGVSDKKSPDYAMSELTESNILRVVNELEDWKEYQQDLFNANLKHKETNYINLLNDEWQVKLGEYKEELTQSIEYCYVLMRSLNEMIDNLKLREIQLDNKEKNLETAQNELELVYKKRYQDLMDASRKMEDNYDQQLQMHKVKYTQLLNEVRTLSKENIALKDSLKIVDDVKNQIFK